MLSILFGFASGNAQNQNFRTLDVSDFETAIANDDIVRLDVRTAEEYAEGHISGAINIDVLKDDFLKRASELPKDKDIALYCRSGNRSKKAAKMLSDNGYRVIELGNGYNGWVKAGTASIVQLKIFTLSPFFITSPLPPSSSEQRLLVMRRVSSLLSCKIALSSRWS